MWPIIPTIKKYHVSTLSTMASFTFDLWVWQLGKAITFWIPVRQYKYELVLSKHTSAPRSLKSAPRTKTLPPVAVAFPLMASRSHCFSPCSFQKERYPHTKSTLLVFCQFSFKLLPNFFICQNMFCHICYRHTHTHTLNPVIDNPTSSSWIFLWLIRLAFILQRAPLPVSACHTHTHVWYVGEKKLPDTWETAKEGFVKLFFILYICMFVRRKNETAFIFISLLIYINLLNVSHQSYMDSYDCCRCLRFWKFFNILFT